MEKWTVNGKECSFEDVIGEVRGEMKRPIGIIVVGVGPEVEGDFKSGIVEKMRAGLQGITQRYFATMPSVVDLVEKTKLRPDVIIVTFGSTHSIDHGARHEMVKLLRKCNINTTAILYAKCQVPEPRFNIFNLNRDMRIFKKEVKAMEENAPTEDGVEYLIVAEEIDARGWLR